MTRTLAPALVALSLSVGCGGQLTQARANGIHEALNAITDYADPTYGLVTQSCRVRGESIVAREGTTREEDLTDLAVLRSRCNAIFQSFEALRVAQERARNTIELAKDGDADALTLAQSLLIEIAGAWREIQTNIEAAGLTDEEPSGE